MWHKLFIYINYLQCYVNKATQGESDGAAATHGSIIFVTQSKRELFPQHFSISVLHFPPICEQHKTFKTQKQLLLVSRLDRSQSSAHNESLFGLFLQEKNHFLSSIRREVTPHAKTPARHRNCKRRHQVNTLCIFTLLHTSLMSCCQISAGAHDLQGGTARGEHSSN